VEHFTGAGGVVAVVAEVLGDDFGVREDLAHDLAVTIHAGGAG